MSDVAFPSTSAPDTLVTTDASASQSNSESVETAPVKRKVTRAKTTRAKSATTVDTATADAGTPVAADSATAEAAPKAPRTRKTASSKAREMAATPSTPETQPTLVFEAASQQSTQNASDASGATRKSAPVIIANDAPPDSVSQSVVQSEAASSDGGRRSSDAAQVAAETTTSKQADATDTSDVVSSTSAASEHESVAAHEATAQNAAPARFENRNNDNRPNDNRPNAADNRNAERGPDGRVIEPRGLRFRGRDGRAEVRRNDQRGPFRLRGDNRPNDNRPEEVWRSPEAAPNGFRPNNRNDNRDDGNRSENPRGNQPQRDNNRGDNRNDGRGDHRGMDRLEREALRAKPELDFLALGAMSEEELRALIVQMGGEAPTSVSVSAHADLVMRALELQAQSQGYQFKRGVLEILPDAKGFLRCDGYLASDGDVYVSSSQIKRFNLKTGDMVSGQVRSPKDMERHFGLLRVEAINGEPPENMKQRKEFEKLTPIFPDEKWILETTQENITARIIELVSPIGRGQRGLIVAPPKAGKTTLIKNIANSIALNHPDVILIVLLIDERPEEVTDISRSVRGEVVASTFDEAPENHVRVAEMVLEKAKRLVEQKNDVVILLDSLTRLSRASNLVVAPSGRTMSGGLDPAAMHKPKKMFGAARNIEEGGSLTILATALVDTGSRMDEYIFEEFKGTGNLDLVLDRNLFDQRIFPAIDINKSGTRRDDLLMSKEDLAAVYHLRRTLAALDNDKAITLLIDRLKNTKTNLDFMQIVQKSARQGSAQ